MAWGDKNRLKMELGCAFQLAKLLGQFVDFALHFIDFLLLAFQLFSQRGHLFLFVLLDEEVLIGLLSLDEGIFLANSSWCACRTFRVHSDVGQWSH